MGAPDRTNNNSLVRSVRHTKPHHAKDLSEFPIQDPNLLCLFGPYSITLHPHYDLIRTFHRSGWISVSEAVHVQLIDDREDWCGEG